MTQAVMNTGCGATTALPSCACDTLRELRKFEIGQYYSSSRQSAATTTPKNDSIQQWRLFTTHLVCCEKLEITATIDTYMPDTQNQPPRAYDGVLLNDELSVH